MSYSHLAPRLHETEYRIAAANEVLCCIPSSQLATTLKNSRVIVLNTRQALFLQGEKGSTVALVLQGFVKLSAVTAGGRETILDVAGEGDMFGELAVLNDWPRATDAIALSPCRVLSIDGREFTRDVLGVPAALLAIARLMGERLQTTTAQMTDALDLSGPARVIKGLNYLAALHSRSDASGLHIGLQLSQRELGGLTGLTRETINRYLGVFRRVGAIRVSGQEITIVDLGRISRDRSYDASRIASSHPARTQLGFAGSPQARAELEVPLAPPRSLARCTDAHQREARGL